MKHLFGHVAMLMLTITAAVALIGLTAGAQTPTAPSGDIVHGKAKFMSYGCYECHGTFGQGNYFGAPHIAPHPLPFTALLSYIRRPAGQMPSYSASILPDKDAADIWAYLSSIPASKPSNSIPALAGVSRKPQ